MPECTPEALVEAAACFDCLTEEQQDAIIVMLLCEKANAT